MSAYRLIYLNKSVRHMPLIFVCVRVKNPLFKRTTSNKLTLLMMSPKLLSAYGMFARVCVKNPPIYHTTSDKLTPVVMSPNWLSTYL